MEYDGGLGVSRWAAFRCWVRELDSQTIRKKRGWVRELVTRTGKRKGPGVELPDHHFNRSQTIRKEKGGQ
jgi:hypothetical protein